MRKLTTPAIASDPYTADAPPVITSMLSISAGGIVLISTTCWMFDGCCRRPSSSTRFRNEPSPRRLSEACPVEKKPVCVAFSPSPNCGSCASVFSIVTWPVWKICSPETVAIGELDVRSRRAIRDPVTMTSGSCTVSGAGVGVIEEGGGVASCAQAG